MDRSRLVLGAMTGTSIDGLDLALVRIEDTALAMRATPVATRSAPLGALAARLRAVADQAPTTAGELAALALEFGELHAREAMMLVRDAGLGHPDLASVHGQTVFHRPPVGWQLLNPHPIARALGCPVVCDLRGADLARGGQGAPLTPLADWVLFRSAAATAVVNLGGFANITSLPADDGRPAGRQVESIGGADVCPCNQLLDRAARACLGRDFDEGGLVALAGRCDEDAARALGERLAPSGPVRSLGTGDELGTWVESHAARLAPADLLATAADAIGGAVGRAVRASGARQVILAGGGARNQRLVRAIAASAGCGVVPSDARGIPASTREAVGWAVLGALAQDGVDIALPQVTRRQDGGPVSPHAQGARSDPGAPGVWVFPPRGTHAPGDGS